MRTASHCIDAGKNAAVPAGITTDLDGLPRFTDVPTTVDTGSGTPPIVDMGAYEFPGCLITASAYINFSEVYQEIEGFGAAGAWYENWLLAHPQKNTLYDILFRDLGLDIYRVRNCYGFDGGYINNTKQATTTQTLTRCPARLKKTPTTPITAHLITMCIKHTQSGGLTV